MTHARPHGAVVWRARLPGLALCALIAAIAMLCASQPVVQAHGVSPLTFAIVLGMLAGNTFYPRIAAGAGAGVGFAKQTLLRTGVVLYGFRLTLQDVVHVGWGGVVIDGIIVVSTFVLACLLGTRLLGLDRKTSMLIGAGSAICGAAAVMAAEPVVRGRSEQVSVAVAGVVIFGTISMFLYPVLFSLNASWGLLPGSAAAFGIYEGSTIHEVAQVIAAGRAVGPEAADTAVITKMVRVLMLAPFLVGLAAWIAYGDRRRTAQPDGVDASAGAAGGGNHPPAIPAFAFVFIGVVLLNSLRLLPGAALAMITTVDTLLLAMAMTALGLSTHIDALRKTGAKPFVLALLLFFWLLVGGAFINHWIPRLLT